MNRVILQKKTNTEMPYLRDFDGVINLISAEP